MCSGCEGSLSKALGTMTLKVGSAWGGVGVFMREDHFLGIFGAEE
jgi:hypothetical protein